MKIRFLVALLAAIVTMTAGAKEVTCKNPELRDLIKQLNRIDEPDSMMYMQMVDRALSLAEDESNQDAKLQILKDQIVYLSNFYSKPEALDKLAQLRNYVEDNGYGSKYLYDAWTQVSKDYLNDNNVIYGVSELQKMQDYATANKGYYGLANVNAVLGELYEQSYPMASSNLDAAVEYMKMSDEEDQLANIYYVWAKSALLANEPREALDLAQKIMQLPDSEHFESLAQNINMQAYLQLGDMNNAKSSYDALIEVWNGGHVKNDYDRDLVKGMAKYLNSTGQSNEALALTELFEGDYDIDKKEIEYDSYIAKKDYVNANAVQAELTKMQQSRIAELQTSQVENVSAYFDSDKLASHGQPAMTKSERNRMRAYLVILIVLAALLIGAIFIIVKTKRDNKQVKEERERTEAERQEIVKLNRMKSTFIQNMSQELRTPLNSIMGFNEILNNPDYRLSEEKRREMLQQIYRQSEQMIHLLDNVVLLSRIDAHDIVPNIEPLRLAEIVEEVVEPLYRKVARGVTFNIERGLMSSIEINTDREVLTTVLKATLDNAVKFTNEGMVELDCAADVDGNLTIVVTDTGDGIHPEDAERVFERFEKLGHIEQGFGLGLSTAKELLEIIGGTIILDTSYSRGARFIININNSKR